MSIAEICSIKEYRKAVWKKKKKACLDGLIKNIWLNFSGNNFHLLMIRWSCRTCEWYSNAIVELLKDVHDKTDILVKFDSIMFTENVHALDFFTECNNEANNALFAFNPDWELILIKTGYNKAMEVPDFLKMFFLKYLNVHLNFN